MRILIEKGRYLLRSGAAGLGTVARLGGSSPADSLPVSSPRIRRAIVDLCEPRPAARPKISSLRHAHLGGPLAYRVRTRLVEARAAAGTGDSGDITATRFDVVGANKGLLAFLGQPAPGFHVFELSCSGFESLWRGDLVKVQEACRPILAGITIYAGTEAIEIEHLAFPVLESGRILDIRGWFDEAYGNPVPSIDWRHVRHVRRSGRSRAVTLPRELMRAAASSGTKELCVLYGEDPGIDARFRRGRADKGASEGRCRLPRGA